MSDEGIEYAMVATVRPKHKPEPVKGIMEAIELIVSGAITDDSADPASINQKIKEVFSGA